MITQLELVSSSMRLGDPSVVTYSPTGISISPSATDEQLLNVGHRLLAVRSYLKWSIGSLLTEMAARRPSDDSWITDFCTAHALDPKDRREMMGVITFYKGAHDLPPLSYEHHREAMWGAGDGTPGALSRALGYLHDAHTNALSYTQLRRTLRQAQAHASPPAPEQPSLLGYSIIFDFMRYARSQLTDLSAYTPERAALVLHDLGDALTFIDSLRALATPQQHRHAS